MITPSTPPTCVFPLSAMQEGMLFHTISAPRSGYYIQQFVCTLPERLDPNLVRQAWNDVALRHDILRTTFVWEGVDRPVQRVRAEPIFHFQEYDRTDTPADRRDMVLRDVLAQDRARGFQLNSDPPWRVIVLKYGESDWRMLWSFHHILLDGRSHTLLLREALATYDALVDGTPLTLPAPRPFRDYIEWLHRQEPSASRRFWQAALAGYVDTTAFDDEPIVPGTEREYRGSGKQELRLSADLTAGLRRFAGRHEVTLNTLVQAAWALVLGRHTDSEDVVFGATRACRHWTPGGAPDMIGLFINTVPFRVGTAQDQELVPWLKRIRQLQVDLRPVENTPLTLVQEWSDMPPGKALFDTILVFENFHTAVELKRQGGRWARRDVELHEKTNYVSLAAYAEDEMVLCLEYPRAKHPDRQMAFILGHVHAALVSIADSADSARLADIDLCAPGEREKQLKAAWLGEDRPFPRGVGFYRIFEQQVERTPDNTAVETDDAAVTYHELNSQANRLARHLAALGVNKGDMIGVCMDRSLELIVALLGIWKAGAVYVPLDPGHPKERLAFYVEDADLVLILAREKLLPNLPECDVRTVTIEEEAGKLSGCDAANLDIDVHPRDPSYVLYTSGSTGKPKGVLSEHEGLCNLLQGEIGVFDLVPEDRIVLLAPPSFDVSLHDIASPLRVGATLVIGSWEDLRAGGALAEFLREKRITMAMFTPTLLRSFPEVDLPDLRMLAIGGEQCPQKLVDQWQPGRRFINNYGPTEVTIQTLHSELFSGQSRATIGLPYPNVKHYVLDDQLAPMPVGVPGELYIGGIGVARGYLNRPELTTERFLKNPFTDEPDMRLYKTGDLVRFLSDGRLEFLRRIDTQVKVKGVRVELGEIEATIARHSAVKEAVVLYRDERLSAFLTSKGSEQPSETALRRFLEDKLPAFLIPADMLFLDQLPRTVSRKVDRNALAVMNLPGRGKAGIGEARKLTRRERERVLVEWNRTQLPFRRDLCAHDLVHQQAELRPDAPALVCGGQTMTYAELDRRASVLACELRNRRVRTETPVVVFMDKSLDVPIAFLAVLKAGGSYVPIDPDVPDRRIAYIVTDCGAPVALTQRKLAQRLVGLPTEALCVDSMDLSTWETVSERRPDSAPDVRPEQRAYIIYTSGSTGDPKGVEIEHHSLANLVAFYRDYLSLTPADRSSMLASIAFDASVADLWPYLAAGACVHVPAPGVKTDPDTLMNWIAAEGITISFVPTALAEILLRRAWPAQTALRFLLTGGDTLHARPLPDLPFTAVNTYGPTENTVDSTWGVVEPGKARNRPHIGRPIGNVTAYILDEDLDPVPIGVPGELLLGGESVARGYLHRPDLTAERFVPDSFSDSEGARLYRTGDLVRYDADGNIEFLGRMDDQVQIRGFRVELGEIEQALRRHPAVADATIRPLGGGARTTGLAAYVVATGALTGAALRDFLRDRVPAYMVPASYTFLDALPRNVAGKVDRDALPEPDTGGVTDLPDEDRPRNDLERKLVVLWQDVLGVVPVGIHDNFFDLGGHSILILRLVARIEEELGRKLAVAALLQAPTVARLAESMTGRKRPGLPPCIIEMQKGDGLRPIFCVAGAGGGAHWFHSIVALLDSRRPFYVLEPLGVSEKTQQDGSIPAYATEFAAAMCKVQPQGPYLLGGFSAGGMMAYDVARQLIGAGDEVAMLFMVDTYGPGARQTLAQRVLNYADHFWRLSTAEKAQFFKEKYYWIRYLIRLRLGSRDVRSQQQEHWRKMASQIEATLAYVPEPLPLSLDLFRAERPPRTAPRDPEAGWTGVPHGEIRVHVVPGNHFAMFKPPNDRIFIDALQACVEQAEGENGA